MFWIFAGGTGGHISPGISLAESFSIRKHDVCFFTLAKDLAYPGLQSLKKESNIKIIAYPASRMPYNLVSLLRFMKNLFSAFIQLKKERKIKKPRAIIAMGGYPCFNALLWARLHSCPYYLCESNSVQGRITKIFAGKSKAVFLAFRVEPMRSNFIVSGNPVRKEFLSGGKKKMVHTLNTPQNILMLGGSQGARDINALYSGMIQHPFFSDVCITLAAGKENADEIRLRPEVARRVQDKIFGFIEDVRSALENSDLVIARAGGSSVYEILSLRKPAILIPFPHAVYDHQRKNALYLEEEGLVKMIDIRPFNVRKALVELLKFLKDGSFRKVRSNMGSHKLPMNSQEFIVRHVEESSGYSS